MDGRYYLIYVLHLSVGLLHGAEEEGLYCPDGWHFADDACFLETPPDMSWYQAGHFCKEQQGNLAFFDSKSQFIQATAILGGSPTWIGLYSDEDRADSDYKWVINETKPTFDMWDEGLPTHGSTACVYIYKMPGHVDHGWHDGSCYRKMPFVCESAKDPHVKCPTTWVDGEVSCYLYQPGPSSWPDARQLCEGLKAHLVVVNNTKENDLIRTRIMKQDRSWIGYWDPSMNDTWQWLDGTTSTWTDWSDGKPNNAGHLPTHCAVLGCDAVTGWRKEHCTAHHPYACEVILVNATMDCPNAWQEKIWNTTEGDVKHCHVNFMTPSTWKEARAACQAQNADLTTLDTPEKAAWAKEIYFKMEKKCAGKQFWIGINDLTKRMQWSWLDSTTKAVFTDWAGNFSKPSHLGPTKGHNYEDYDYYIPLDGDYHDYEGGHKLGPGDTHLVDVKATDYEFAEDGWDEAKLGFGDHESYLPAEHHEDVAVLMLTEDSVIPESRGRWMNVHHTAYFPALCESEDKACVSQTQYQSHVWAGHCYRVLPPHEWGVQEETCRDHVARGATSYLAIVNDQDELEFIKNMTKDVKPGIYIGLNAYEKPHEYTWLTSKPVYTDINRTVSYTNWLGGEPHSHPRHRCAVSAPRADGKAGHAWSDAYCLAHLPGLCRRKSLSSEIYYDFKIKNNVYKVSPLRMGGLTDFSVLCTGLLGHRAYLANITSQDEYRTLTSLLHHQFSGAADLWIGNASLDPKEHPTDTKADQKCPPVLTIHTNEASLGSASCCESKYALCEKQMKSKENYDVRVGNMLYKFFTVHTNVNYSEAEMACQKAMVYRPHPLTVDFRIGTLATVSHAQQYMQLSSEMRILYNAEKTTKYWMGKSTSYIDFQDNRYVVRDAGLRGQGPCLVASLPTGISRRLTQHDHIQIREEKCHATNAGYICQRQMTNNELLHETNIFKNIFSDIMTRFIKTNQTALFIHKDPPPPVHHSARDDRSSCEGVCVDSLLLVVKGLAVALPIMAIAFFIFGFLLARYFSRAGYMLMIPHYRRHGGTESVNMINSSA